MPVPCVRRLTDRVARHLNWFAAIRWDAQHDTIRTTAVVPDAFHDELAHLRGALADAIESSTTKQLKKTLGKLFSFWIGYFFAQAADVEEGGEGRKARPQASF